MTVKAIRKNKGPLWTLSPLVVWLSILVAIPLLFVVVMGFLSRGVYGNVEFKLTIENYLRVFNPMYLKMLLSSLWLSLVTTVICLAAGYPFAYFIANAPKKIRGILLMLIIIPFWTNSLIRTYAWIILLRTSGIINSYLMQFGIISEPIQFLYTNGAVVLGLVYTLFPFMVLPLFASIDSLDKRYLEAASDLGARPWMTFCKITVPLTMPGIVAGCILVFIPTLGLFFIPDLMGGSKIMLISNFIKNQFLTARDWPFGSAASIVLIALTFVLLGVYIRILKKNKNMEVM
ncbi:MAG: ABC transporter permease subunit [Sedimentibacter sp.]|uniref:ABC transporter permease n=1 Tax=Sedimentibacter sp. TaxID=1960295 RepID=UPI003159904A